MLRAYKVFVLLIYEKVNITYYIRGAVSFKNNIIQQNTKILRRIIKQVFPALFRILDHTLCQ